MITSFAKESRVLYTQTRRSNFMRKFKRIFAVVMDSVGIGAEPDADRFFNGNHNDVGSNTWLHISEKVGGLNVPTMTSLGLHDLCPVVGTKAVNHPHSYVQTMRELSNGKDTLTGHWEMMGIETKNPLVTFTDTGFPKELLSELEGRFGRKLIGNYSQSGTVILDELGEQSIAENALIVYTSSDSVLQLAGNIEKVIPLEELYRDCEIAREICMRPEYRVGRIIARPFRGEKKGSFVRTTDRRDYALEPSGKTSMISLREQGYYVYAIGKIHDIFAGTGMDASSHIDSNHDGMLQTIDVAKNKDFTGLCFVNLADFDVLYGHRRNPQGYAKSLEEFDADLKVLLDCLHADDLLMITADHGNDPTWWGTDHTREKVPLISYSPSYRNGRLLEETSCFGCMGKTILKNFGVTPSENQVGYPIDALLDD